MTQARSIAVSVTALLLLLAGCSPDRGRELIAAASSGDVRAAEVLLEAGADIETKGSNGETAVIAAALNGHAPVVELLLEAGADPDVQANHGNTALFLAAERLA